jgi:hypothetical protein
MTRRPLLPRRRRSPPGQSSRSETGRAGPSRHDKKRSPLEGPHPGHRKTSRSVARSTNAGGRLGRPCVETRGPLPPPARCRRTRPVTGAIWTARSRPPVDRQWWCQGGTACLGGYFRHLGARRCHRPPVLRPLTRARPRRPTGYVKQVLVRPSCSTRLFILPMLNSATAELAS